jgi:hypothetical protein
MTLPAEKMDMIFGMFMVRVIERIFDGNVVYRNAMDDIGIQECLYGTVKCDAVVQVAHFRLDFAFGQRTARLLQQMDQHDALGGFLQPFTFQYIYYIHFPTKINATKLSNLSKMTKYFI